jgi:hypothetical protein
MKNNIRQEVIAWNNRFPLDRWWRNKHKISFQSPAHRESTFFGQCFEYYEDLMIKEYRENAKKEAENSGEEKKYKPMSGDWWSGLVSSESEIEDWFNTLI